MQNCKTHLFELIVGFLFDLQLLVQVVDDTLAHMLYATSHTHAPVTHLPTSYELQLMINHLKLPLVNKYVTSRPPGRAGQEMVGNLLCRKFEIVTLAAL